MVIANHQKELIIISFNRTRKLNILNLEKLKNHLMYLVETTQKNIYIDFSGITFIDSQTFEYFKFMSRNALNNNIKIIFFNIDKEVGELFNLVDKDKSFTIIPILTKIYS